MLDKNPLPVNSTCWSCGVGLVIGYFPKKYEIRTEDGDIIETESLCTLCYGYLKHFNHIESITYRDIF